MAKQNLTKMSDKYKPGQIIVLRVGTNPRDNEVYERIGIVKKGDPNWLINDNRPYVTYACRGGFKHRCPESQVVGTIKKEVLKEFLKEDIERLKRANELLELI